MRFMTDKYNTFPALATIVYLDRGYRGRGESALAGQGRRERERLFSEGSLLNFNDGLSDEGAFIIVISDGTRVEHAGSVAIFRTTEA
jgi:hypothetical protein